MDMLMGDGDRTQWWWEDYHEYRFTKCHEQVKSCQSSQLSQHPYSLYFPSPCSPTTPAPHLSHLSIITMSFSHTSTTIPGWISKWLTRMIRNHLALCRVCSNHTSVAFWFKSGLSSLGRAFDCNCSKHSLIGGYRVRSTESGTSFCAEIAHSVERRSHKA